MPNEATPITPAISRRGNIRRDIAFIYLPLMLSGRNNGDGVVRCPDVTRICRESLRHLQARASPGD